MTLALSTKALPAAHASLEVRTVRTKEDLTAFGGLAFGTFGFPVDLSPVAFTEALMQLPHPEMFLGYVDGTPVCCSMLLLTGRIAGIYWVGVDASARRRGLGAAITAEAVQAGRDRGGEVAVLQASKLGEPVYRRLGFATVRHYARYDLL